MKKKLAIFLDRDGVIIEDKSYMNKIEQIEFISGSLEGLKKIPKRFLKIIVSNQSGVGRGYFTPKVMEEVNSFFLQKLKENEIHIDKVYICPHSPEEECHCRKPEIGLFEQAQRDFNLDLKNCFLIGDRTSDIKAGENAGCKTILVKTGYGGKDSLYLVKPDFEAENLKEAIEIIIKEEKR
jgi:histidinol-phosphate phosphatase family protein